MTGYFRASAAYMVLSFLLVGVVHGDLPRLLSDVQLSFAVSSVVAGALVAAVAPWLALVLVACCLVVGWREMVGRARPVMLALLGTICLQAGFSILKNAIPDIVPYYADPFLARLDAVLHGGVDPWVLAHGLWRPEAVQPWLRAYMGIWSIPAMLFVAFVVATDGRAERVSRYVWLYFGAWLGLGTLAALGGASVGPVFHDRLLGGDRFADLVAALAASGVAGSEIGVLQDLLWQRYVQGGVDPGLGISAFPSMHVAIATITALYLAERSPWLAVPGWGFLALILFLSVYTGYHYAVDGYASVICIIVANRGLLRKKVARGGGVTIATVEKVV